MKKLIFLFVLMANQSCLLAQQGWYEVPNAPTSPRFEDVSLVGSTVWVAENGNFNGIIVHKSLDKGDTWVACDTLPGTSVTQYYIRSVEFMNDSVGLLGCLSITQGTPILFRTTDGGSTFNPVSSPAFTGANGICGMAHYDSTFIAVGIYDGQANFFKSTDMGVTWSVTSLIAQAQGLVDCYMFNDSTYLVSGHGTLAQQNSGTILRTTNGGLTWQQVALDTDPFGYCWKMSFLPNGKGIASIQESESVFLTSDFGATWSLQNVGNCDLNFGATAFLNDTLGWVGDQYASPCFYETRDGGSTWTLYFFGNSLDRMVLLDSQTVMAVGATIYKYSSDSVPTSVFNPPTKFLAQHELNVFPNPVIKTLNVELQVAEASLISIFLLDEKQNLIKQLTHKHYKKGKYLLSEDVQGLASGSYLLYLTSYQKMVVKKFTVVK